MNHQYISATEFKAKCLSLFDQLEKTGGTITVTKRGRPVVKVEPAAKEPFKFPWDAWKGKVQIVDDIVNYTMGEWEFQRELRTTTRKRKK